MEETTVLEGTPKKKAKRPHHKKILEVRELEARLKNIEWVIEPPSDPSVFGFLVKAFFWLQKTRVACELRLISLGKQMKEDKDTVLLYQLSRALENFLDWRVAHLVHQHLAYSWLARIAGTGPRSVANLLGLIDFEKAKHPSSLWKFAGFHVRFDENGKGHAPRPEPGKKLDFCRTLRSKTWLLASNLIR